MMKNNIIIILLLFILSFSLTAQTEDSAPITKEELEKDIESHCINLINDFQMTLKAIVGKKLDEKRKVNLVENFVNNYFHPEATIETSSLKNKTIKKEAAIEYFRRVLVYDYKEIEVNAVGRPKVQEGSYHFDGKKSNLKILMRQHFWGRKSKGLVYEDYTLKTADVDFFVDEYGDGIRKIKSIKVELTVKTKNELFKND